MADRPSPERREILGVWLLLGLAVGMLATPRPARAEPSGIWVGQDGRDLVGNGPSAGGNDVQDIHIRLAGLPIARAVASASIKGLGGDEWSFPGGGGSWRAELLRRPGAPTADLYLDPTRAETGRGFEVHLRYDDGREAGFWVQGGKADPNLRVAAARLKARWAGQEGRDRVGAGVSVGPDGHQDARIALANLSGGVEVTAVRVEAPGGSAWQAGTNPRGLANAELVRGAGDSTRADLYLQPDRDFNGRTLKVSVGYANGKVDAALVVAGRSDPSLRTTAVAPPTVTELGADSRWLGQDERGDVRVAIDGLPVGRRVVGAVLSDGIAGTWAFRAEGEADPYADPFALPLSVRAGPSRPGHLDLDLDLTFPPIRSESGATLTLRLAFEGGSIALMTIPGGPADPALRSPGPGESRATAHPGDDLQDLAHRFGAVRLSAGVHERDAPLILDRPVSITADPGATIRFRQPEGQAPWATAIEVRAGRVALDGFAVRFAGPVRWASGVSYGPAVVGVGAPASSGDPMAGLAFTRLDLEGPPASSDWEEAPRLLRLAGAANGRVVGCTLKGGVTEFLGGPWAITGNTHRGTVPNTYAFAVFAGHATHDLDLRDNRARPVGDAGKTWRFLVLTVSGANDRVADNDVVGVGPRDDDTVPGDNAAEVVLTEAYGLHFEGRPASISADRRIVQVVGPPGGPARTGSVVAVVAGPDAGRYRRVAQALGPGTYRLDEPLPPGVEAVSIATGFVDETFRDNVLDLRGSKVAAGLVLVGDHFGTRVSGNTLKGGGEAIRLTAAPTEWPVSWGWSHAPALGVVVAGNTIEDAWRGATITVEHGPAVKSSKGRVYLTASLTGNTFRWTAPFLARLAREEAETSKATPRAWTIGDAGSLDPGELVVEVRGDRLERPDPSSRIAGIRAHAARINGREVRDRGFALQEGRGDTPPAQAEHEVDPRE